ncbi:MAG: TonB-dependent receptor [Rhizobiales bacterium]|nr:TonB-dependent receptor [Hyphomicrobiales bacterium]
MGIQLRFSIALALTVLLAQTASAQDSSQDNKVILPPIDVSSSRLGGGIAGSSTSVITAEDIARSPSESLQDVIGREVGVQTWNLFGGVNGAGSTVDMRGFGAAAGSNTLVLINGRRLNDIDMANVNFAAIPRNSIERIEITRGNSGAVLYGDNVAGGVINIITKTAVAQPPTARIESALGSFRRAEGNASASGSSGPWSASLYGSALSTDGYRVNNATRQHSGVADFRYTTQEGSAYLNLTAHDQRLGLPGARRVDAITGLNQLESDRRGATTPFDYANTRGSSLTAGVTRNLWAGTELIVDGGLRFRNDTAAAFLGGFDNFLTTGLTTGSVTPRITSEHTLFGLPSKVIAGIDFYDSIYQQDRGLHQGDPPIHSYRLRQRTLAGYGQDTIALLPTTDLAFGARVQQHRIVASDVFDPAAPTAPFAFELGGLPLDQTETNKAWHVGIEHRFNGMVAIFGRAAQSFRTPNVDERVGMAPFATPTNFDLRTQTSRDIEGGLRFTFARLGAQWSVYDMELKDELHFSPATFTNTNLDPTRRYGSELSAKYQLSDNARLTGGASYTRAVFREGPFTGSDVPLVSRWTGNIGGSWDIWQKYLTFDGIVRYVGPRRMDNDQTNLQPMIPPHTVVDVRLGGVVDRFTWSVSVQNLFNSLYFDYAAASAFTIGTYNAYPLPGRTFMVKAGATF